MQIKTVLTVQDGDKEPTALNPAIALCRHHNAHLSVFVVGLAPAPPTITYGGLPADLWIQEVDDARRATAARCEAIEAHLQQEGISADVTFEVSGSALIDEEIGRRARYADLTAVIPGQLAASGIRDHVINGALFESDRPLIVLNGEPTALGNSTRVLVAWDASREAARAIHASLEQLKAAEDVRVVLVDPEPLRSGHGPEPGANIATFLARHGIGVTVERIASSGHSVADSLILHGKDCGAGLIVMGAYGHSRMRQRVFGGTTESMLGQTTFPLLMMH
ncbi:MAG: universal stress protein [Pseudomonadota bacterium]